MILASSPTQPPPLLHALIVLLARPRLSGQVPSATAWSVLLASLLGPVRTNINPPGHSTCQLHVPTGACAETVPLASPRLPCRPMPINAFSVMLASTLPTGAPASTVLLASMPLPAVRASAPTVLLANTQSLPGQMLKATAPTVLLVSMPPPGPAFAPAALSARSRVSPGLLCASSVMLASTLSPGAPASTVVRASTPPAGPASAPTVPLARPHALQQD